jgi:hypothetical protein
MPFSQGERKTGTEPPEDFRSDAHAALPQNREPKPWWRNQIQLRTNQVYAWVLGFCQVRIAPAQESAAPSDLDYRGNGVLWMAQRRRTG